MQKNIKIIYPTREGDVTQIISTENAVMYQHKNANAADHYYADDQAALDDLLSCPTVSRTSDPVGMSVQFR